MKYQPPTDEARIPFDRSRAQAALAVLSEASAARDAGLSDAERIEKAVAALSSSLEQAPRDASVRFLLGCAAACANDPLGAASHLRIAVESRADFLQALKLLADCLLAMGIWSEAEQTYRRALGLDPGMTEARLGLGYALRGQEDHQAAAAEFRAVLAESPNDEHAHIEIGKMLLFMRQNAEAVSHLQEHMQRWPESLGGKICLALATLSTGDLDTALDLARVAFGDPLDPESPADSGDAASAQLYLEIASMGEAALKAGIFDTALLHFLRAGAYKPREANAFTGLGLTYVNHEWRDMAELCFRRAVELAPNRADLLSNLGGVLSLQGRHEEALEPLKHAAALDRSDINVRRNVIRSARAIGDHQEVVKACKVILMVEPNDAVISRAMAQALRAQGKDEPAIAAFRRTLQIDPEFVLAASELAEMLTGLGRWDEAIAVCTDTLAKPLPQDAMLRITQKLSQALFDRNNARTAAQSSEATQETAAAAPPPGESLPDGLVARECRYGTFLIPTMDLPVARALGIYGEWRELTVALFRGYIEPGMTVLDIGANLGALTLPLAALVGSAGVVFASEFQPAMLDLLMQNCARNGFSNVTAIPALLGRGEGTLRAQAIDFSRSGGSEAPLPQVFEVQARTLDSLGLTACDLINCDQGGLDADALGGAVQTIEKYHPVLYVQNERLETSPDLILQIMKLGYRAYWHLPAQYNPDNWAGESVNLWPNGRSISMLCLPNGSALSAEGLNEIKGPDDRPERYMEA